MDSIFNQTYKEFEIVVIDNNSQDKTVEFVRKYYPRVNLIVNKRNMGFPYGCNQGIGIAKGRYILTLNSDVTLENDFLHKIKKAMDNASSNVGMISPKILWAKNKELIDSTGLILSRARRFFSRGSGEIDKCQHDQDKEILGPCAAAALYKKEMLENIKLLNEYFDSDFFLLLEDFDLAWRAKNFGWKVLYAPETKCYHVRNVSGMKTRYVQYLCFRNRYFLMIKNDSIRNIFKNIFFILPYDILRFLYFLVTNEYAVKALRELMIALPKMLKKRQIISSKKRSL